MPREALLVQTLVDLADSLVEDFDVIDVLSLLGDRCVQTLDVAEAGVMLAAPNGELQVVASSSETMRSLELFQLQANEGPCVDCFRSGQPIVNVALSESDGRWPLFTMRAMAQGIHSVHSLPMRLRGRTIGALNMFRTTAGAMREDDVVVAQALADVATIAILQHEVAADALLLNSQLSQALNSRVIIEQAKGKVSESAGLTMDQAFQRLRNHARNHNARLTVLCRDIAAGTMDPRTLDPYEQRIG
jgi:GAF domain-containing protein